MVTFRFLYLGLLIGTAFGVPVYPRSQTYDVVDIASREPGNGVSSLFNKRAPGGRSGGGNHSPKPQRGNTPKQYGNSGGGDRSSKPPRGNSVAEQPGRGSLGDIDPSGSPHEDEDDYPGFLPDGHPPGWPGS